MHINTTLRGTFHITCKVDIASVNFILDSLYEDCNLNALQYHTLRAEVIALVVKYTNV